MNPRFGAALLCALAIALPSGASAQQLAGLAVTTPSEAMAAVNGILAGVAQGAADLHAKVAAQAAGVPKYSPTLGHDEAIAIATADPKMQDWLSDHVITRTTAELETKDKRWKVSFIGGPTTTEVVEAEVYVGDAEGNVAEIRVGPQVAWMMARGSEGAFGRAVNRWRIWIPLCVVFLLVLLPVTRPRSMWSWRTLDLLTLLSFTASWAWFNQGEIATSVPLQYPPLIYLLGRMVWITVRRARLRRSVARGGAPGVGTPDATTARARALRAPGLPGWMPTWLLVTVLILLLALRWGLNGLDSNVIDVGYAGVIGADLIQHGETPYGNFPESCGQCDTYGPLSYALYVPFELAAPYTGTWDSLPAAHGAAVLFDGLALLALIVLGWRLAGKRMGLTLGIAWAAFPFTAFTLSSNSNDALIAACIAWGLVLAARPMGRGLMIGLGVATKIVPVLLVPLWARHPFPRTHRSGRRRRLCAYIGGLVTAALLTGWVLVLDGLDGITAFWSRTVGYQIGRDSPFSIWGQHEWLRPVHLGIAALVILAALVVLWWPRRLDIVQWAAIGAALVIGFELVMTHWFYLYIPWFLPLVLLVVIPEWPDPAPTPDSDPPGPRRGWWSIRRRRGDAGTVA